MKIIQILAVIILLGIAVYGRILWNGFVGDDPGYINHPFIQQLQINKLFIGSSTDLGGDSPITGQFYRPVMLVVLSQIYQAVEANAWTYHLVQLIFHISNTFLVYFLMRRFVNKDVSFISSLIFLAHPINVEAVVYVSNLQDVLFVFFGLTAMNLLIYKKSLWMIPLTLLLSLLSKETGILFSISALGYMLIYRFNKINQIVTLSIVSLLIYTGLRFGIAGVGIGGINNTVMGSLSMGERLIQIPAIIWYYLKTFLWPDKLAIGQVWTVKPETALMTLIPVTILSVILVINILKTRSKTAMFFGLWMVAGLLLHLQIVPLEMTVADRWMYFVMIGVIGLIGQIGWVRKNITLWAVIILLLSGRSWVRAGDFKDALTLYKHDTQITESYLLEHSLGYELMQKSMLDEAKIHFEKSIKLFENTTNTNSLGVWNFRQNNAEEARKWFARSTSFGDNFQSFNNLARVLISQKNFIEARNVCLEGTDKFPKSENFWFLLAIAEYQSGNKSAALAAAQKAYSLSPTQLNLYVLNQLQTGQEIKIND